MTWAILWELLSGGAALAISILAVWLFTGVFFYGD